MTIILDQPIVIEVSGPDAGKILHNLTTNQIQSINVGESIETFVTDVRGWTVAHGLVYRSGQDRWLWVGQHPKPTVVSSHIDRYIIREQAEVKDLSGSSLLGLIFKAQGEAPDRWMDSGHNDFELFRIPFLTFGEQALLVCKVCKLKPPIQETVCMPLEWEQLRISHFWPRMGVDIWEKCIPQEIDRDAQAISFTKGCYLGQETIARLDARGQIQKKLCLLRIEGAVALADKLLMNDQEVGHITSSVGFGPFSLALAVVRRGHFAIDTRLTCNGLAAQVIDTQAARNLFDAE